MVFLKDNCAPLVHPVTLAQLSGNDDLPLRADNGGSSHRFTFPLDISNLIVEHFTGSDSLRPWGVECFGGIGDPGRSSPGVLSIGAILSSARMMLLSW